MADLKKDVAIPTLTVTGGPRDGASLELAASAVRFLGSAAECHLRLELGNVAPRHAKVLLDPTGLRVQDLGGDSGTYVNGEKLSGERTLSSGDRLCLGPPGSTASVKLLVRLPPDFSPSSLQPLSPQELKAEPPPAASPPRAAAPAASQAKAAEPRKPQYTSDLPSIVPEKAREASPFAAPTPAPAARPAPRAKKRQLPRIPPVVFIAGGGLILLVLLYFGYGLVRKPSAVIDSINPSRTRIGQNVTLKGKGFDANPSVERVLFDDIPGHVTNATPTEIAVMVPQVPLSGASVSSNVTVEIRGRRSTAVSLTIVAAPQITSLEPDVAMAGDEISIRGNHLDGKPLSVVIGGLTAEIKGGDAGSIRVKIPDIPTPVGKDAQVVVSAAGESSQPLRMTVGHLPIIKSIRPKQGAAGERVTISGKGFDASGKDNLVTFDGQPALVVTGNPNEIIAIAPGLGLDSEVRATVEVRSKIGTTSGPNTFVVTRPSSGLYTPHFFAAPATEHPTKDHVFVSNEIAPVLLLTGKAEAPSSLERAEKVAAALNALIASLRSTAPPLEIRDKPTLSLALSGSPTPLVSVTQEDAAGYDEGWEGVTPTRRTTPQALASYWLALLQDQLSLFVLHQRPTRIVQVSQRGRAMTDLFSEAARRSTDAGIPTRLLNPLPAPLGKAFREMALVLPSEGQVSAGTAIEGVWSGTWDESGTGTQSIEVSFRLTGGKLAGALTTRAHGVEMAIPLNEATFDKGTVRFAVQRAGSLRYFNGTLEGNAINGTVGARDTKEPTGRFSLRFTR